MSEKVLHLPKPLAGTVLEAAARAYPRECCGLIEGIEHSDGWQALAVHETANVATEPERRFLIDPQAQFDLLRRLRSSERRIVGCFHSHPDGTAAPSARDLDEASTILGIDPATLWRKRKKYGLENILVRRGDR